MSEYIVSKMQNGNDTYKFKSAFQKEIAITAASSTSTYPNKYIKISGIPTSSNSTTKSISLLVGIRYNRYLINITPFYNSSLNNNILKVIGLSIIDSNTVGSVLSEVAYAMSSTSATGTMDVYLKIYAKGNVSRVTITNISEDLTIPFEVTDIGNDNASYSGTTISAYFNTLTKGSITNLQTKELSSPISIGGISYSTVESALSAIKDTTGSIYSQLDEAKADLDVIAEPFSNAKYYARGEYVIYNGEMYMCNTKSFYGDWDSSKWTKTTNGKEIDSLPSFRRSNYFKRLTFEDSKRPYGDGAYELEFAVSIPYNDKLTDGWKAYTATLSNGPFDFFPDGDYDRLNFIPHIWAAYAYNYSFKFGDGTGVQGGVYESIDIAFNSEIREANKIRVYLKMADAATNATYINSVRIYVVADVYLSD